MKKALLVPGGANSEAPKAPAVWSHSKNTFFLRRLSDQLRNPLAGAQGSLALQEEQIIAFIATVSAQAVALSPEVLKELLRQINEILQFSQDAMQSTRKLVMAVNGFISRSEGKAERKLPRKLSLTHFTQAPNKHTKKIEHRVLIVEDSKGNQKVLARNLTKMGCVCQAALNGQEAVDAFKAGRFEIDLILMDINMPIMDGNEATRQIRKIEQESNHARVVPIIRLSSNTTEVDIAESRLAGMTLSEGLGKPFDFPLIKEVINKYSLASQASQASQVTLKKESARSCAFKGRGLGKKSVSWPNMTKRNPRLSRNKEELLL